MSKSREVECVTQTSRAKDQRAKKLGVPPRTLWSNDQNPALLVYYAFHKIEENSVKST